MIGIFQCIKNQSSYENAPGFELRRGSQHHTWPCQSTPQHGGGGGDLATNLTEAAALPDYTTIGS